LGREDLEAWLISRPILIECLMEALLERGIEVVYRTVRDVEIREEKRPVVRFLGVGEEAADLVVGADGIRSVVRNSVFGDGEKRDETKVSVSLASSRTLSMAPTSTNHHTAATAPSSAASSTCPNPMHSSSQVLLRRPTHHLRPRSRRNLRLRRSLADIPEQTHLLLLLRHRFAGPRFQT
jgi:2-polyprenyl-6-methoxyphenol hydroxylase-like FAD-dependent oxidoreductase